MIDLKTIFKNKEKLTRIKVMPISERAGKIWEGIRDFLPENASTEPNI